MKVLITGGTGFVGRSILAALRREGHAVSLLARHPQARKIQTLAQQFNAEIRPGNVLDASSLQSACTNIDAVIHLVGIISEIGDQTFERVHTQGTANGIAAAQRAGAKRFVHMSALGTRPGAVSRYHKSKWAAEELVRNSGLDWTIFRPAIIYGPGDGFVNLFAKITRFSPVVPIMGSGTTRFQPVPVEAVADAFVRSLATPAAVGKTFDLCGREVFTLEQIIDAILEVTRRRRLKLHVPLGMARLQAAVLEFVYPTLLHKAPPLNRDQLLMLQEDNTGDPRTAADLFGLHLPPFHQRVAAYLPS